MGMDMDTGMLMEMKIRSMDMGMHTTMKMKTMKNMHMEKVKNAQETSTSNLRDKKLIL